MRFQRSDHGGQRCISPLLLIPHSRSSAHLASLRRDHRRRSSSDHRSFSDHRRTHHHQRQAAGLLGVDGGAIVVEGFFTGDVRSLTVVDFTKEDREGFVCRVRLFFPAEGGGIRAYFCCRLKRKGSFINTPKPAAYPLA